MIKKSFLFILILLSTVSISSCGRPIIEWMDFIKFDGITYVSNNYLTEIERNNIELGEVYSIVEHKVADVVSDIKYKNKDGDAAFHEIGTQVYSVVGYDTSFRLAIETEYGIKLYEVDRNPNASIGADILDIENKVDFITLNSELDAQTIIIKIDNETDVKNIVNIVLNSPIIDVVNRTSDYRYFLEFHLTDGTTITRSYWIDDGLLTRNIKLPNEIKDIINPYLEN